MLFVKNVNSMIRQYKSNLSSAILLVDISSIFKFYTAEKHQILSLPSSFCNLFYSSWSFKCFIFLVCFIIMSSFSSFHMACLFRTIFIIISGLLICRHLSFSCTNCVITSVTCNIQTV